MEYFISIFFMLKYPQGWPMKTIFEKIVKREIPAYILLEDSHALSFLDINPKSKGHLLIISKKPYQNILECPENVLYSIIKMTKKATKLLEKTFNPVGFNTIVNHGELAGQEVPHFHIHVIPKHRGDQENSNASLDIIHQLLLKALL